MARRSLRSPKVWLPGAAAAALAVLAVLVLLVPDSSAHPGHTGKQYRFSWNRGSTVTLDQWQFWHWNRYRKQLCFRTSRYDRQCDGWRNTDTYRERKADSCAARPEWVQSKVVKGVEKRPSPPSSATCNRHGAYFEGNAKWIFVSHRTAATGRTRAGTERRCRLPITGIQSSSTSTNTSPPGGASTVYRTSRTQPGRGSPARCGWWSGARLHSPDRTTTSTLPATTTTSSITTITTATTTTTTTAPRSGKWSGRCSFLFQAGHSYSSKLPTHSGTRVSGYSYSGERPGGMAMKLSPPQITGTPTRSGTFVGTLRARMAGGRDATLRCYFRVSGSTVNTTTTTRPARNTGWTGSCHVTMRLGSNYGDRRNPEEALPWYEGADEVRYSGKRPRGVNHTRIRGKGYLYGTPAEIGTFKGTVSAWRGRKHLSTRDCLIVVSGGAWNPAACRFNLRVGSSYNLAMPRYSGVPVERYYPAGALPPGLSTSASRLSGSPTSAGSWSVSWTAAIDGVSARPAIICTFYVTGSVSSEWSGTCHWTFTVGYAYTRLLPVADGATTHAWTGGVPDGMRMRYVKSEGVWAQQLSGTPTAEGLWIGTVRPGNPRPPGVENLDCSFQVLPEPTVVQCSRTIPATEIDRIRGKIEWRSDFPRTGAHPELPGGGNYLLTTGDPGVGGGSPRVWPWWPSGDALTVTDTTDCEWRMTEIISAARPLFPWYRTDLTVIRRVSPAMHTQWQAMTSDQRTEVEAIGRQVLRRVGLGAPENEKWLGNACQSGDTPETDCIWGLPFPGVWQWSLTVRYRSPDDSDERSLTIASGATRFWRFGDQVGG